MSIVITDSDIDGQQITSEIFSIGSVIQFLPLCSELKELIPTLIFESIFSDISSLV